MKKIDFSLKKRGLIMLHYYEIKNTYVTDKGYLGVTDEIFEI